MNAALHGTLTNPRGRFATTRAAKEFTLAGNARVTLVSVQTNTRFTYRVSRPAGADPKRPHFVALLRGPDNDADYTFLGTIFPDGHFVLGRQRLIGDDAPSARAFKFYWQHLRNGVPLPPLLEVWHEGRCGRCGRSLTVPESVARGLGPECAGVMGEARQGVLV